jgi:hypothetical protein
LKRKIDLICYSNKNNNLKNYKLINKKWINFW